MQPPPLLAQGPPPACSNVLILEAESLLALELEENLLRRGFSQEQIFYAGVQSEAFRQLERLLKRPEPLLVIANSALGRVDDGLPVLKHLLAQRSFGPMLDIIAISHSGIARGYLKELKITRILEKIPVFQGEAKQLDTHLDEIQGILCRSAA